jgi:5-methylcytosine-specific restriction endonuclease McrA
MKKKICKNGKLWGSHNSYKKLEYKEKCRVDSLGKKNPNYKNGNSYSYQRTIYIPLIQTLVQKCSLCGKTKKLVTHHIDFNYKNNILNNLTIVCRSCHNKIHKKGEKKK